MAFSAALNPSPVPVLCSHSSVLLRCPVLRSQGMGGALGWSRHAHAQTHLLVAEVTCLQNTDPGAGRKGTSEVLGLGRRHPHPLATALALVTDTVFAATIRIA